MEPFPNEGLGRFTGLNDGQASCTWKCYRREGKTKTLTLAADEFAYAVLVRQFMT